MDTLNAIPGAGAPPYLILTALGLLVSLVVLYRLALPKPLPGIPYNDAAVKSILGDVPSIMAWKKEHGEQRKWFAAQAVKHNSPVVQVFTKPFAKPQVILTDHREIHDIFTKRHREFDRGYMEIEAFGGVIPDELLSLKTPSPEFRFHKDLMKELMLPNFLQKVIAPEITKKVGLLVDLWRMKARVANGRPFSAKDDLQKAALDVIMAGTFGLTEEGSCTKKSINLLKSDPRENKVTAPGEPFSFAELPLEPEARAVTDIAASVEVGYNSPLPVQHHWLLRQLPHLGGAIRLKNKMLHREIDKALARMPEGDNEAEASFETALDNILFRERSLAKKAGRKPSYHSTYILDEMLAYLIAGHDTTSNTLTWGLIYLTDNQEPQLTLRKHLHTVFADAVAEKRQPTSQEITKTQAPYLDAVVEEILRMSVVIPMLSRQATVDTTVLGYHIPKDTSVMLISNGPSFHQPGMPVDESLRSKTSQASINSIGSWNPEDAHLFKPERWLETDEKGNVVFNARKGPMNSFGGGPRGCFGKRLAYMELRVTVAQLFYNFEFQPIRPELRSYRRLEHITISPAECLIQLKEVSL